MLNEDDKIYDLRRSINGYQWSNDKLTLNADICDCADVMFYLIDNDLVEENGIKMALFNDYVEFDNFEKILEKAGYSTDEMHCVFY